MKLARLVDPNFHKALEKLGKQDLPAKVAFRLKGIAKRTREESQKYEEVRQELLQKHGKKDEGGALVLGDHHAVQFDEGKYMEFAKDLAELVNEEVEISTIKLSDLGDNITMTLEEIEHLDGLVVE